MFFKQPGQEVILLAGGCNPYTMVKCVPLWNIICRFVLAYD